MKKNKALAVPFVLWAILFIAVPLVMVVWYGVTVEETPAYVEVEGSDGQTMFQLEDGTLTAERPEKQTVVSLANFKRMLEPTYLKLLLRSLKIALFTTILCNLYYPFWKVSLEWSFLTILSVLWVAIMGHIVAYTLYIVSASKILPTITGVLETVEPLTAIVLSYFFFSQKMNGFMLAGAAMVLIAVVLLGFSRPKDKAN